MALYLHVCDSAIVNDSYADIKPYRIAKSVKLLIYINVFLYMSSPEHKSRDCLKLTGPSTVGISHIWLWCSICLGFLI